MLNHINFKSTDLTVGTSLDFSSAKFGSGDKGSPKLICSMISQNLFLPLQEHPSSFIILRHSKQYLPEDPKVSKLERKKCWHSHLPYNIMSFHGTAGMQDHYV